jgi:hypothetical protein
MEGIMRIRRTTLGQVILTISAAGALMVGPVVALTTAAAPVSVAAEAGAAPNIMISHG